MQELETEQMLKLFGLLTPVSGGHADVIDALQR
jgi:hypothetical protein